MTSSVHARRGVRRAGRAVVATLAAAFAMLVPLSAPEATAAKPFDVLQLNLCHSGADTCAPQGQSVKAASGLIKQRQPDVVTLNEVCAHDITTLVRETGYLSEFAPSYDESTADPSKCADGRGDYGIAILSHPDQGAAEEGVVERKYRAQDAGAEQRVVLCVPYSRFSACTSQLSAADGNVAAKQCSELIGVASGFGAPTVIGGDFSLRHGGRPDIQDCVPTGWFRKGDGSEQHVFATNSYRFQQMENLPVEGAKYPGFLVRLSA